MQTDSTSSWRSYFDRQPGRHRPHTVRNGALFVAACLIFVWILYTKPSLPLLSGGGTTFAADFTYGANVRPGYTPVRTKGVEVGQVTKVERHPSGRGARVTMKLDDGLGVELKKDARADLRWRTLLGRNLYIDLRPGSSSAPPLRDAFIPKSRTSDQVELDTALEPLDDDGRAAVQTIINEFDKSFAEPRSIGETIDAVAPAMRPLAQSVKAMRGTRPGDLSTVVASTSRAMGELSRHEVALGGLIDNANVTLGVTAAQRASLAGTVRVAPDALNELTAGAQRLRVTLDVLDPLAAQLRPGARALAPAARETQRALDVAVPLLSELRPALRHLRPAVKDLGRAADLGVPSMQPMVKVVERASHSFVPFLQRTNGSTKRKYYQLIGPAIASAGSALAYGDRHGAVGNFEAGVGEASPVLSPCTTRITNPEVPLKEKVSCELFTRVLAGLFSGTRPEDVKVTNSKIPLRALERHMKPGGLLGNLLRRQP